MESSDQPFVRRRTRADLPAGTEYSGGRAAGCRLAACAAMFFAGCAVQNHGFVAGRVVDSRTARTVDIYALGLVLSSTDLGAACTFGLRKDTYLLPLAARGEPASRTFFFAPPDDLSRAIGRASRTIGADLHFHAGDRGLRIGFSDELLLAYEVSESGRLVFVDWDPAAPEDAALAISDFRGLWTARNNKKLKEEENEDEIDRYCWDGSLDGRVRK